MKKLEKRIKRGRLNSLVTKVGIFVMVLLAITITNVTFNLFSKMRQEVKEATDAHMSDIAKNSALAVSVSAKNLGNVKFLVNTPVFTKLTNESELTGIEGSYIYVVSLDGTMLTHPTKEKIGNQVENEVVKEVLAKIKNKETVEPFTAEYQYRGGIQYAAIYPDVENGFVLVVAASEANVLKRINAMKTQTFLLNMLTILGFSVIGTVFVYFLMRPLKGITKQADRLTELDFAADENLKKMVWRKDEIGQMAEAIEKLQQRLFTVIEDIKLQSDSLYTASEKMNEQILETTNVVEQVSTAVQEIADGANSQAEDTQTATEKVVVMGNAVEKANKEVENLYESTGAVKASGDEAVETLTELTKINQNAKEAIDIIYTQTNMTNDSVKKIHEATALITEIAEETNLLSLNASIEAARAGEAGRGFAVVAAQIQKLAEQSNASANQIEQIIDLLTDNSEKAVATMQEVMTIMKTQEEKVEKTERIILDVREKIAQSIDAVGVIAESTEHIDETRKLVIDLVQSLSAIAEENAANTEETSASVTEVGATMGSIADNTEQLKEIAKQLDSSMQQFKLS